MFRFRKDAAVLILTREKNEIIRIGDDIIVEVIEIRGKKVRLGIDAPITTSVHRGEVFDAILREKKKEDEGSE